MKTRLLLSFFVFFPLAAFCQTEYEESIFQCGNQDYVLFDENLTKDSESIEAFFTVEENTKDLRVELTSLLENGRLRIEMYNPRGKKSRKDLIIDTSFTSRDMIAEKKHMMKKNSNNETNLEPKPIDGSFFLVYRKPKPGQWKMRVVPEDKARGRVKIRCSVKQ